MTIGELKKDITKALQSIYNSREAQTMAHMVVEHLMNMERADQLLQQHGDVQNDVQAKARILLMRLLQHEPLQYVLGEAWFYNIKFKVDKNVLIPRPETEELVEWIIEDNRAKKVNVLDVGSGSGCINIIVKKYLQNAEVTAIDISSEALEVAKRNAERLSTAVDYKLLDFLDESQWDRLGSFDIIISNPPYVSANEFKGLEKHVADYEPKQALVPDGEDPLIFYRKIKTFADSFLIPNGKIYLELNTAFANDIEEIFKAGGFTTQTKEDMQGNVRMLRAIKELN